MFRKKPKVNPEQEQREKLAELGTRLQQLRSEQGLSLEAIARQTRIPRRLLEAIEAGKLEELPEPIYIRWLIKQFAESLGLDGAAFSQEFPLLTKGKNSAPLFSGWLPLIQLRPIHLYFLYILLVFLSIRSISQVLEQAALRVTPLPAPSQLVKTTPTPVVTPSPESKPVSDTGKPVVVEIKLKDDCWLKVVADGKTQFEGILRQGTQRRWQADKELTVRAGNAGGVYVIVNQEQAKQLGKPGQVEEVTYTATAN
jgi:cytoskeletal protein RodZ